MQLKELIYGIVVIYFYLVALAASQPKYDVDENLAQDQKFEKCLYIDCPKLKFNFKTCIKKCIAFLRVRGK
ncbi:UNVERIFIED_CONTAM: hypothetical protein RMT77_014540 [Armadillidium vulgare]